MTAAYRPWISDPKTWKTEQVGELDGHYAVDILINDSSNDEGREYKTTVTVFWSAVNGYRFRPQAWMKDSRETPGTLCAASVTLEQLGEVKKLAQKAFAKHILGGASEEEGEQFKVALALLD